MSGLVFGGITPHGSSIIEEIAGSELDLFKPTREGMEELAARMRKYNPETIVILTPHGLRLRGYNAIYTCAYCSGSLSDNGNTVYEEYKCDQALAKDILSRALDIGIPCVGANYGGLSGPGSNVPMDWGTLIPLHFLGGSCQTKPEIVVIGPTREISLGQLVALGRVIAKSAADSGRKVALIASADQAHTHDPNGIYGYDSASKEYDSQVISIIKENCLEKLLDMDLEFVERAKPDSLWQMLILYGALEIAPMKSRLISYQAPTYFGMLVASFETV